MAVMPCWKYDISMTLSYRNSQHRIHGVDVVLTSNLTGTVQFLQSLVHDKCVGDGYILNVLYFSLHVCL